MIEEIKKLNANYMYIIDVIDNELKDNADKYSNVMYKKLQQYYIMFEQEFLNTSDILNSSEPYISKEYIEEEKASYNFKLAKFLKEFPNFVIHFAIDAKLNEEVEMQ